MKLISLRLYTYKHLVIWIIISYYVHLVTRVSRINSKDKFLSKFRHNCCSFDFKISMRGRILRVNITVLIFLRKFSFSKKLYLTNIVRKFKINAKKSTTLVVNRFPFQTKRVSRVSKGSYNVVGAWIYRFPAPRKWVIYFSHFDSTLIPPLSLLLPPLFFMIYVLRESCRYAN